MTDTSHRNTTESSASYREPPTAWAGWVVFGGVMLITVGAFQVVQGLVALFDDGFYAVTQDGLVVDVDYNTWGWIHTVIGVVAILTGLGLLAGNMVARVVGVGIALLSALVNLAFLPAYPIWSTIMIALDVIVIYAIIVHGREVKAYR
ncbi:MULTISPECIES: DUF7144 family membrane protein [unclassified Geodermatophilus]